MKTLSTCYQEHYNAAYALLDANAKKIIDKYKSNENLSKSNEFFAQDFVRGIIDKSEKYFESQDTKNKEISPQISELKNDEIIGI